MSGSIEAIAAIIATIAMFAANPANRTEDIAIPNTRSYTQNFNYLKL